MIGQTISHYKILGELGRGGMGVVYKAEDLSLHRTVALKFLPAHTLADDVARERFKREARAAAALDHPNICSVYEIGEHEGRSFIVMAFLEGESLSDKVRRGPLDIEEAVGIAARIAEGLDHAHQRGVIHRDIKSANIFITAEGRVKIIDLGLARRIDVSTLTDAGTRLGTVAYMSPEQARGDSIDGRSDIWSLGVVLYEMLAGKLPFAGDAFEAIVYSILHVDPKPVTEARPEVSADLVRVTARAMARDPEARYQNAGEFLADLLGPDEAVSAGMTPTPRRVRRRKSKRWIPTVAGLGLAVAVVVVVVLVFFPSESVPFRNRDWILITDFDNQTGDPNFDGTIGEALAIDLQQSQYVNVYGGRRLVEALTRMEIRDTDVIGPQLGGEICLREGIAAMLTGNVSKLGESYIINARIVIPSTGDAVMTERATAKDDGEVLAAVDKLSKKIRRNLGESLFSIRRRDKPLAQATTSSLEALRNFTAGNKYLDRGDSDLAVPFYEKAIDVDSTFAIAYAHLAVIRSNKGSIDAASALSDKAMRWRDGTSERERYYIEAEHYRLRSAYAEAVERYHLLTDLYPDSFGGHNNLAFLYQYTRQYEDALVSIAEAERVRPDTWYIHHNRALAYAGLGEYEEASRHFDAAIEANPRVAWSHMSLSWVKMFTGDVEGAMEQLEFDDDVGIWTFQKSRQKTYHYLYQGRDAKAVEHIHNNLTSGPGASIDWVAAYYHQILGRIHMYRHDPGYGVEEMQKAVIAYESWLGRFYLGLAYVAGGMESEALAVIDTLDAVASRNGLFPTRAAYYRVKGELQLARGNTDEATKQFASAQRYYDTLAVREALARAFDAQGDTEKAIAEYLYIVNHQYATFFEDTPLLWPLALYRVAGLYDRTGDTAAAGYYTRFLESQKDGDPDAWRVVRSRDRLTSLARGQ